MVYESGRSEDPEGVLWHVSGVMIGGPALWGGIGWLVSLLTGWSAAIPVGIVIGFCLSMYICYVRYFSAHPAGPPAGPNSIRVSQLRPGARTSD